MEIGKFNRLVNLLLIYMVTTVGLIGVLGNDIVSDMVLFVYIYGIPLAVFIIIYLAAAVFELRHYLNKTKTNKSVFFIASLKLVIAIIPMFYLNNTGAHVLSLMRVS